jgi:rod shape determining protein RodA
VLLHFKKLDWLLTGAVFVLCAISLLALFSIDAGQASSFFSRQILFFILGLVTMFAFSFFDGRIFRNYTIISVSLYLAILLLLASVLFFGHGVRGTISWIQIGSFNFEPVELAKIIEILVLAKYFSGRHVEVYRIRHIVISGIYAAIPVVLVLLQPDLGSVLILAAIWLGIVILSGIRLQHLLIVVLAGALVVSLSWLFVLAPYQKARILTFVNPNKDPLGYSYNLIQSKTAVGSGGLFGKGLGQGTQGQLNFLPEKQNDFIFAVLAEEWGLIGVLFLFIIYIFLFWRLLIIIFKNIGMNLGLLPITGISLPFISYGGSNLLINFIALGIIQNIAAQTKRR